MKHRLDTYHLALERAIGEEKVFSDEAHRMQYAFDESGISTPYPPDLVVHPETAEDVEKAVHLAYQHNIPVTARGGGSGVTGGALPIHGGVLLVFDRMNRILDVDSESLMARVQPGVITGEFQKEMEALGLFYPPDPASLDMCSLGGNVAENAGGPRALKYGVTKHYLLEVEVVDGRGERFRLGKPTKKWVVGYDLLSLVSGSEGTLGIFTEITVRLLPRPSVLRTLWALFPDELSASRAVSEMIRSGLLPRVLEFADRYSIEAIRNRLPDLPTHVASFLLIEFDGNQAQAVDEEVMRAADILERHQVMELFAAEDPSTRERLWAARRAILPSLEVYGKVRSEDVVVPRRRIPDLVEAVHRLRERTGLPIVIFGHAGDGNLHVNFTSQDPMDPSLESAIRELYQTVLDMEGTIAGEHGIGLIKRKFITMEVPPFVLHQMRSIKGLWDPAGILNPGKIFPDQ